MISLTVMVPVFNEPHLVAESLRRLEVLETSPDIGAIQIIVVDDSSTDTTPQVIEAFAAARGISLEPAVAAAPRGTAPPKATERGRGRCGRIDWLFVRHDANGGKGAAVRSAIALAECEVSIIHDADLEYHPSDIIRIVDVFLHEQADVVVGSRFAGGETRRALMFRHELGNRLLTLLTNLVTNVNLTDMESCYKAVRTDLLKSIPLVSNDFRIEPELIIKFAKREARIFEIPIRYSGRTYLEGRKIGMRDGVQALAAIARFAFSDHIYADDEFGSEILGRLARAPRFNEWMAETVRPFCGQRVLEIGSGTGNLTRRLIPRERYVASDINPVYLSTLHGLTTDRPYLDVTLTDVTKGDSFPPGGFDTVVCLNVIEHVDDDQGALSNIHRVLAPGGKAIILVPHSPKLFGSLDEALGRQRRYTESSLRDLAQRSGFRVTDIVHFNRVGTFAWWLNGRVLRRRTFGLLQIIALNTLTPVFRRIDGALPLPPLSLIALMEPIQ